MTRENRGKASEAVAKLCERISRWRETRKKRTAMPEELWQEAAKLGREFGIYPVARELNLHYGRLKQRVHGGPSSKIAVHSVSPGFVEIPKWDTSALVSQGSISTDTIVTEVEVSRPDGVRIRVKQSGGLGWDVSGILAAYFGRGE